jgi:hypothetical protein
MVFSIRQNATQPILKMKLFRDGRNDYNKIDELLENASITFAMKDEATGIYKIANEAAKILLKDPCATDLKPEYYIAYEFKPEDTNKPGIYLGEFKIVFFNKDLTTNGDLIVPISEQLYIHVLESFVKSDIFQ